MLSLLTLLAAGSLGVSSADGSAHARTVPVREEARDDERTYWRREGTGWRRVTRGVGEARRHEWAPSLPADSRAPEGVPGPSGLFRPWIAHETSSWPEAVGLGDLNGDGRRDVAMVTSFYFDPENDYRVFVFLQTATGALAPPVKYPLPDGYGGNQSLEVGDVTGDGRDDVVVGSGNAVLVLRQNASGALDAYVPYPTQDSFEIKIGDFNHDGRKDVAGIGSGPLGVAVFLQNTGGTLDPPLGYPANGGGELESGDINNDGREDIVVKGGLGFEALLQLPAGGFAAPVPYALPVNTFAGGVETADVNTDGRKDVVMAYGGNQPAFIGIYPQNAAGTLNPPFSLASYDIPEPVESADLDANGRSDLAVLHGGWVKMGVYLQGTTGTLGLEALEPIPYASHYAAQGITLGDINSDGRPDAVIADYNHGLVVLYQKAAVDLGVSIDGPTTAVTGASVGYQVRVRNVGSGAVAGAVLRDTTSGGLQYVTSYPSGACFLAAGSVTCPLPPLAPGQETQIELAFTGISPGAQTHQVTVTPPQADGYPGDNLATFTTTFLGSCQERVQDGSFEQGTFGGWLQTSTNFGTPLCTAAACGTGGGTALPHTGSWWAWFGGIDVFEQGSLTQNVTLPTGTARLRFQLWIGARSGNGSDFLRALMDGTPVFAVAESTPGFGSYTLVDVDVSAYANGGTHSLRFDSTTFGPGVTNFSLDQVSLEWCPLPTLSIADAPNVNEGDAGTSQATFAASLSQPAAYPITVNWATGPAATGVPATPVADYTPAGGVLTFPAGTVSLPLGIAVSGDLLDEFDETFGVNLAAPTGATLGDASGQATIVDNDPLPTVSIADAMVVEGHAGTSAGQLTVSLAPASGRPVSGTYATANGTATAGSDYTATSAGFAIPAGSTSTVVSVPVTGDIVDEVDETFFTNLSAPDFANVGDGQAVATIDDDDGPTLAVADASATEGDAGSTPASFTVSLSGTSVQPVTIEYATAGGTAVPGGDFTPTSGTLTFVPGETTANVPVPVLGDTQDEPNEFFDLVLSNVTDALPLDAEGRGTIVDDDGGTFVLAGDLTHGVERWRSLTGPTPRDLFVLPRTARSSYEVVVDGASGDYGTGEGPTLRRWAADLSIVLQNSVPVGSGPARRLSVRNELAIPEADYIEVASASCSTDCGADDLYRIVARETTLSAPRFNNSGGQVTVVLLQNRTDAEVLGHLWFWAPSGDLLAATSFALGARQSFAFNTPIILALAGRSGTVTATHDAPYGGLAGKAVAIEPATGFGFDTPFEPRRR